MSFPVIVSRLQNVIKLQARYKGLMRANPRMCIMKGVFSSSNDVYNEHTENKTKTQNNATQFKKIHHASKVIKHVKCQVFQTSALLYDSHRYYSQNSSESNSVSGTERLSDSRGPVHMFLTEEGKLQVHVVPDSATVDTNNHDINNNTDDIEKIGLETKLIEFINENQTDSAIKLLNSSGASGKYPHSNVVILLLEKLGENGHVESLLQLQNFVLDKKLCNTTHFLNSLTSAYYESGRIKDAIEYLKNLFENNHDYSKVQNHFIFFTTMILKKYPLWQSDIVSLVNEYKISRFPKLEKELWICFILSENFNEAEQYVTETESLKKNIPNLISELNAVIRNLHKFSDEEPIWKYLLVNGENLGLKRRLKLTIYAEYLISLANKQKFREVIFNLRKAKINGIKIPQQKFDFLSQYILKYPDLALEEMIMLKELIEWYKETTDEP